jgi:hypothetical protein
VALRSRAPWRFWIVSDLLALENLAAVHAGLTIAVGEVVRVAHKTTSQNEFTLKVHRRNSMTRSDVDNLIAMKVQKGIDGDD